MIEQLPILASQREAARATAIERESALEIQRFAAEQEVVRLKQAAATLQQDMDARASRINQTATQIAKYAFYLSGIIFAGIGILSLFGNLSLWFGVPAMVVGFFNLWSGFSGNTVEQKTRAYVFAKLSKYIG